MLIYYFPTINLKSCKGKLKWGIPVREKKENVFMFTYCISIMKQKRTSASHITTTTDIFILFMKYFRKKYVPFLKVPSATLKWPIQLFSANVDVPIG